MELLSAVGNDESETMDGAALSTTLQFAAAGSDSGGDCKMFSGASIQ
jgi:hypothetical protein